ncbi:MAG: SEC-C metal-binding domain-containing protein [Verrucomicrobiales bacterium]
MTEPRASTRVTAAAAASLLESLEDLPISYGALRAYAAGFDPEPEAVDAALREAMDSHLAEGFTKLVVLCGMAGRYPGAWVLEHAELFTRLEILLGCALKLSGDPTDPIIAAIESEKLAVEREAALLLLLFLWREANGIGRDHRDGAIRELLRHAALRHRRASNPFSMEMMSAAGDYLGDADFHRLLGYRAFFEASWIAALKKEAASEPHWQKILASSEEDGTVLASGGTVRRAQPRVGRNDPCPCGSGKKFKKCCEGKGGAASYEIDGYSLDLLKTSPELSLTAEKAAGLRPYEIGRLDPAKLSESAFQEAAIRLAEFHEYDLLIRFVDRRGIVPSRDFWQEMLYHLTGAPERRIVEWAAARCPEALESNFTLRVRLASYSDALELVVSELKEGYQLQRIGDRAARVRFMNAIFGAAEIDPAFGLVVARGALPDAETIHYDLIEDEIDRCRIELGKEGADPAIDWMERDFDREDRDWEYEHKLERQRAEASKRLAIRQQETEALKKKLALLQDELRERERAATRQAESGAPGADPPEGSQAALDELRERARILKRNLSQEHEDHARDRERLDAAMAEIDRLKAQRDRAGRAASCRRRRSYRRGAAPRRGSFPHGCAVPPPIRCVSRGDQ